jgi:hypothetical protein
MLIIYLDFCSFLGTDSQSLTKQENKQLEQLSVLISWISTLSTLSFFEILLMPTIFLDRRCPTPHADDAAVPQRSSESPIHKYGIVTVSAVTPN